MVKQVHEVDSEVMEMIADNNRLISSIAKQITGDKWLTVEEAARYIKKSVNHLRGRLKEKIGYSQPEREILFNVADLDAYLMKHYHPAKD
jgi:hypothetical protein